VEAITSNTAPTASEANGVRIESAGTAEVNGDYTFLENDTNGNPVYTNTNGYYLFYIDMEVSWCIASSTDISFLSDSAYYASGSSNPDFSYLIWDIGSGTVPAPTSADIKPVEGNWGVGDTLTANYNFTDPDGDNEGDSTYQWYHSDSPENIGSAISGATNRTYTLTESDIDQYLTFEVIPVDEYGAQGTAYQTNSIGIISDYFSDHGMGGQKSISLNNDSIAVFHGFSDGQYLTVLDSTGSVTQQIKLLSDDFYDIKRPVLMPDGNILVGYVIFDEGYSYGTAYYITIDTDTWTISSPVQIASSVYDMDITSLTSTSALAVYNDRNDGSTGKYVSIDLSTDTVSTPVDFNSSDTRTLRCEAVSSSTCLVMYNDGDFQNGNGAYLTIDISQPSGSQVSSEVAIDYVFRDYDDCSARQCDIHWNDTAVFVFFSVEDLSSSEAGMAKYFTVNPSNLTHSSYYSISDRNFEVKSIEQKSTGDILLTYYNNGAIIISCIDADTYGITNEIQFDSAWASRLGLHLFSDSTGMLIFDTDKSTYGSNYMLLSDLP